MNIRVSGEIRRIVCWSCKMYTIFFSRGTLLYLPISIGGLWSDVRNLHHFFLRYDDKMHRYCSNSNSCL